MAGKGSKSIIQDITPLAFGGFGALIIIAVVFSPNLTGEQRAFGIGAGTTAIGTGGGIAKQVGESKSESEANVNVSPAGSSPDPTGYSYHSPSLGTSNWQLQTPQPRQYMGGHQGSSEYPIVDG